MITCRRLKNLDINEFCSQLQDFSQIVDLEELVSRFSENLKEALDTLAPETTKRKIIRDKYPWFSEEIKNAKQKARSRERVWRKYKENHQWVTYTKARNSYNYQLKKAKRTIVSKKLVEFGKNSNKIYSLVNILAGIKSENPLPLNKTKQELSEEFGDFFLGKIQKIRNDLADKPLY